MPAGNTYEAIATTTLSGSTSSVTLSSIPSTYTDLIVVFVFGIASGDDILLRFNGDSGSNYSSTRLWGDGTSALSNRTTSTSGIQPRTPANQATTVTTSWRINIMNYANTTTNKTTLGRYDYASGFAETDVGLWRNTAAINSIGIFSANNFNFSSGSTISLYGVKNA
jgi:hypothetical protein